MKDDCLYKSVCTNDCSSVCLRYSEMSYLLKTSNIPKGKQKIMQLTPEFCDESAFTVLANIRENIVDFIENGKNLYIYSENCGNGKTTWSIKLMLQYFNEIWPGNGFVKRGVFINVPTFLTKCKAVISQPDQNFEELRKDLIDVDLVVWDDIASTKLSDYDYNLLLTYIDQRVLSEKSNFFTGNILPPKLHTYLGERLSSRVCNESTVKVQFLGGDNR